MYQNRYCKITVYKEEKNSIAYITQGITHMPNTNIKLKIGNSRFPFLELKQNYSIIETLHSSIARFVSFITSGVYLPSHISFSSADTTEGFTLCPRAAERHITHRPHSALNRAKTKFFVSSTKNLLSTDKSDYSRILSSLDCYENRHLKNQLNLFPHQMDPVSGNVYTQHV